MLIDNTERCNHGMSLCVQDAPSEALVLAFFDIDDSFSSLTPLRSSALTTTCTLRPQKADLKQCKEGIRAFTSS